MVNWRCLRMFDDFMILLGEAVKFIGWLEGEDDD